MESNLRIRDERACKMWPSSGLNLLSYQRVPFNTILVELLQEYSSVSLLTLSSIVSLESYETPIFVIWLFCAPVSLTSHSLVGLTLLIHLIDVDSCHLISWRLIVSFLFHICRVHSILLRSASVTYILELDKIQFFLGIEIGCLDLLISSSLRLAILLTS